MTEAVQMMANASVPYAIRTLATLGMTEADIAQVKQLLVVVGGDMEKGKRLFRALLPLMRGCSEISESTVTDVLQAVSGVGGAVAAVLRGCSEISESTVTDVLQAAGVGMTEAVQMMMANVKAECLLCC
jgi:ribosomal protein L12E/L44/L45/RPP1/RPP2